ncbi:acyl-CoA dehydrogenase family protein [Brevibacterium aurantiacum]|uniref:acyl-CoA dehydrogenase family protein n=1 Tax=Brevibacterium aurantiacum TaxID=273384 RepID=UPI0000510468|nr:acyl-CoA dehydrogenase family protein [Brevibacterium aurantiacum]AZL04672.1 acyl-CoA dehydrogenase [Brevibacterium aurantiacum]AZL11851.1 acyl-CoA dehydrogenase [Brevibacterium aurantiacum]MDN5737674.1 acyl-CoA dehydrogenase family protein [Brevibacterium aurantiacum]MDN5773568.1 acyl-CoA dehydrogenase family protein [Brevibacterium aurantiacum]
MILDGYRGTWETQETDDLRELVRNFMNKEIVPHQDTFIDNHQVDRELWNRAGDAGLLCISIPEEYGGGGGTFAHEAVILQEQGFAGDAAWGNSVHSTIIAHYINTFGTEEQKKRWLPGMATGELVAAIAMTEPGTGSDLQSVKTKAVRDGDEYVVNGSKTFISNGTHCDILVIVARTSEEPGAKGVSLIVAEVADLPGFSRGRVLDKVGQRGQDTRELFFEDMRVPVDNVLGGVEGRGFIQLMQQLPQERMAIAVAGATTAEAAVREAVAYAKEREAFGQPIMKFQNTKFVLAECATEVFSTRTFVDHLTQLHIDGKLTTEQASAGKYWATDAQTNVIDRCLQVFGGYGYMMEYPIARMYADARVQKIYGGTNEIMKELISRGL